MLLAGGLLAGLALQRRIGKVEPPSFQQLTFRRGDIQSARFSPDGQTVIYTAAWGGKPMEIFLRRLESPESRPSGLVDAELLAVSGNGDMAVSLNRRPITSFARTGRLASVSIAGGVAPREILDNVEWADWAPNGKELAVVRDVAGRNRLEYPVGRSLYETAGWIGNPRVSRSGNFVAFCDHPARGDARGIRHHRGPRWKEDADLRRLLVDSGAGLVSGRSRSVVYRDPGRREPGLFTPRHRRAATGCSRA